MMQASAHHSTPTSLDRYLYKNVPTYRPISMSVSFTTVTTFGGEFYWDAEEIQVSQNGSKTELAGGSVQKVEQRSD